MQSSPQLSGRGSKLLRSGPISAERRNAQAKPVNLFLVDPLVDNRWNDLLAWHPRASVFHQRGWLQALALTYGYKPYVITSTPPGQPLKNGLVLCRVSSWMTGARMVSLPFADHCDPLWSENDAENNWLDWLWKESDGNQSRYVELRPLVSLGKSLHALHPGKSYWFHELGLAGSLEEIFGRMHKGSFQRKIRRAEKEQLTYDEGRSQTLVDEFYRLLLMTRRRHRLLPQPRLWFENLVESMGANARITLARKDGRAIAGLLTLSHDSKVVYKYGCSDAKYHHLGGMPFLFWRLIEQCKAAGIEKIDLGRSDLDNRGLGIFKDRMGAQKRVLTYYRYSSIAEQGSAPWKSEELWGFFSRMPDACLSAAGRLLYRHMG
jgi:CelD/BcsL family acetyltransferase involved in cellulose biosynthesis